MYILGTIPQGTCHHRDVQCWGPPGVGHWISYQLPVSWTAYCLRLTPVSHHTVESTKALVLFSSPTESHWPDTSLSPWNEDRQREDDFPGSWLTWSFSFHTHTPSPISSLLVTKSCPAWCYLTSEGLNKSIKYLPCTRMSVQKSSHLKHRNVHIK